MTDIKKLKTIKEFINAILLFSKEPKNQSPKFPKKIRKWFFMAADAFDRSESLPIYREIDFFNEIVDLEIENLHLRFALPDPKVLKILTNLIDIRLPETGIPEVQNELQRLIHVREALSISSSTSWFLLNILKAAITACEKDEQLLKSVKALPPELFEMLGGIKPNA